MKFIKSLIKWMLLAMVVPVIYIIVAVTATLFTVKRKQTNATHNKTIFLNTNGVHLDIIIPKKDITPFLNTQLSRINTANFIAFGWGEENFYLNTPTWKEVTFYNAFRAAFLKNTTIMHLVKYHRKRKKWIPITISSHELELLNQYILNSFKKDAKGNIQLLKHKGYSIRDDFYKANGQYSFYKTCNSWVNSAFKYSGLKASYWTLFDFGLLHKYQ